MAYTFWHGGILIGESELAPDPNEARHLVGIFSPTAYGLELFPRLIGMFSAAYQLKTYLEDNGLDPEEMEKETVERVLDTTPAGQKIIDIGRALSDVEMRAPDGKRLEFTSIGFSDVMELRSLLHDMKLESAHNLDDLPADAPRYIVSATVRDGSSPLADDCPFPRLPEPRWPADN
jgi:hypothetical protein